MDISSMQKVDKTKIFTECIALQHFGHCLMGKLGNASSIRLCQVHFNHSSMVHVDPANLMLIVNRWCTNIIIACA